ncbi:hypothetical protein TNCT_536591 [Trichonephila clavata]|uniref:Uncharacterized protein n=1 Tax=Trichonephila clavata TaxID=2740835 RepID=A0A8X6LMG9_TRICU|nr:hypothetical protein TNCT_536591 [Trichonephila clavata]
MNNSLAITEPEEKIELSAEIAAKKLIENYEDGEIDSNKDEIMSDISVLTIHESTKAFSNGMDNVRCFKKFTRFTQKNISGVMEQTPAHSNETPLAEYSKYVFSDDNGEQFIIDNAEFEEEEKEIVDILNSNSEILPSNPFYERGSFNENYHFFPIPSDASPYNPAEEDMKVNNIPNNEKLEILPSNPFYEMGSHNENYFIPIPLNTSPCNFADEDMKVNNIPNNQKLEILPSNPFYEMGSRNENYFIPIPLNASPCNSADEDAQDNYITNNEKLEILPSNPFYGMGYRNENYFIPITLNTSPCNSADENAQGNNIPNNEKLEIFPSNPFYEMGSPNENDFIPISLNAPPCNSADEDAQENAVDYSKKKNFIRKVKCFFKKLRTDNSDGFTYQRFK